MKITFRCPGELEPLLPRPWPARQALPEWLKSMPLRVYAEDLGMEVMTVKKCPPFVDAMGHGFMMPLTTDITVEDGRFEWDWQPPPGLAGRLTRSPLAFHLNDQVAHSPLFEDDAVLIKFNSFWTIETEPGWSLLVTHPFNRLDLPFRTLTGLVDADLYRDNPVNFVAQWVERGFAGVLPAGTPVAQCVPVQRAAFELAFEPLSGDAASRFVEARERLDDRGGVYRRSYRAKKR